MQLRLISASEIDLALSMSEAVDIMDQAFDALGRGLVRAPQRSVVETENGASLFMPAYLSPHGPLAVKIVSFFGANPEKGLPAVNGLVLVLDPATGVPQALMDGTRLTALRTGAGAGAATRALARADSKTLAMFGSGGQAFAQIAAVLAVRPIEEIRLFSLDRQAAQALSARLATSFPEVKVVLAASAAEAVLGADVVSCATTSKTPVFDPGDVRPGTHINGVGAFTPAMREVQLPGLANLRVFVDRREAALAEAGDIIQTMNEGLLRTEDLTEIGDVIGGRAPGRTSPDQITFFKSVGVAVQDAAAAGAVLRQALRLNLGRLVDL
ncbi:MAG: ornithine cyclodeaminase family protein [Pseudomonadota bacterium]